MNYLKLIICGLFIFTMAYGCGTTEPQDRSSDSGKILTFQFPTQDTCTQEIECINDNQCNPGYFCNTMQQCEPNDTCAAEGVVCEMPLVCNEAELTCVDLCENVTCPDLGWFCHWSTGECVLRR